MSRSKRNAAAEDYFKMAPNYSGGVVESLRSWKDSGRPSSPDMLATLHWIADRVEAASKFYLPTGGLFDETPSLDSVRGWRTPFPLTVFEFDRDIEDMKRHRRHGQLVALVTEGRGWLFCFQLYSDRDTEGYVPTPYFSAHARVEVNGDHDLRDVMNLHDDPLASNATGIVLGLLPGTPEMFLGAGLSIPAGAAFVDRAADALTPSLRVAAQTSSILACTNVTTEILRPNREARAARPASTLFDYHVLMIDPSKERNPSEDRGGTHASPRTHLRRGHIRRLAWGPRVWVNSCVVNPSAIGTVNKDYAVKRGGR